MRRAVPLVMLGADAHPFADVGVFLHVGEQIAEDLLDGIGIRLDHRRAVQIDDDLEALPFQQRLPELDCGADDVVENDWPGLRW
jgi:hypothetical protein